MVPRVPVETTLLRRQPVAALQGAARRAAVGQHAQAALVVARRAHAQQQGAHGLRGVARAGEEQPQRGRHAQQVGPLAGRQLARGGVLHGEEGAGR